MSSEGLLPPPPPVVPPIARGEYLTDFAVARRWETASLDALFRDYWPAAKRYRFEPLNDEEARPETPFPYCVFRRVQGTSIVRSTHSASTSKRIMYEDIPIQFSVYAKPAGVRDGETVAEDLLRAIMEAFTPGTELFDISPDRHATTISQGNWIRRVGDQEWVATCAYLVRAEATYDL